MSGMDRQWLHHPATGGYFHCPVDAVKAWEELGWVPGDEPEEINPAVVENLAWRAAQTKPAKSTKPGASATGSDKKE